MDELTLLAEARPAVPCDPATVAEARDRLVRQIAKESTPAVAGRTTERRSHWQRDRVRGRGERSLRRRLIPAAAGAMALVGLGVAVIVAGSHGKDGQGPTPATAQQVLLVAAERSQQHATTGQYWLTEVERGSLREVGPADNRYAIMGRDQTRSWHPLEAVDEWTSYQWLGAAPATDADRAVWERDGSPDSWPVEGAAPITAGPGPTTAFNQQAVQYHLGLDPVTIADLRALSTDPARLKAVLLEAVTSAEETAPQAAARQSSRMFQAVIDLLMFLPVSSDVRAAAYRVLADMPDVRAVGTVTDQQGRSGAAVAITEEPEGGSGSGGGLMEFRLIVDEETGQALALETRLVEPRAYLSWITPGALFNYTLLVRGQLTDETPSGLTPGPGPSAAPAS